MEDNMNEDMEPKEIVEPRHALTSSGVAPVEKKEKTLSTKQKKKLVIEPAEQNMLIIKFVGGGQVPDQLRGYWNNSMLAQRQIDLYLAERK